MLPPSVAVSWAASVLMQLHEIRSWAGADWFHGALRPAHVLLGPQGELYILDPILSKAGREIGLPGRAVDAPQYAAPETFSGQYTFLSDQFSVGAILAEWLTGSPLYAARDPSELQILAEEADVSRTVAASRQYPALGAVIQKLLAKDPRHRFSDSSAAAEALSDLFIEGPTREQMTAELLEWSERFRMLEGADAHFDEMDVPEGADDATDDLLADVTPMVPHAVSAGPIDEGEPESTPVSGMWERTRKPSETPTAITHPDAVERERANRPITVTHTMVAERPWWESRWFAFFVGATLIAAPTLWWLLRS